MTLGYKLFGRPGNLEEFVNEVKKQGIREVELSWTFTKIDSYFFMGSDHFEVSDKSHRINYRKSEFYGLSSPLAEREFNLMRNYLTDKGLDVRASGPKLI